LERNFEQLVDQSIAKFPNLWTPDAVNDQSNSKQQSSAHFLSPPQPDERVMGHYCAIKPLPEFMREFLRNLCEPYGVIVETKIRKSKADGTEIGLVDFKEKESAERAVAAINGSEIDGVKLFARYICKQERPKALDLLVDRQCRSPIKREKQSPVPQEEEELSETEASMLTDLSQQWAYFSELHGSKAPPLETLILNMKANKVPPKTTIYEPVAPKVDLTDDIRRVLDDLSLEIKPQSQSKHNRKLEFNR